MVHKTAEKKKPLSYVTLFSGAGIGCQAFSDNGFECVTTNELISKRLDIQKFNCKCKNDAGYVLGDINDKHVRDAIYENIERWKSTNRVDDVDVFICTPPCQGMSIANHHKNNELKRNSLIVDSITITKNIGPKIFIFENVKAFLNTKCLDIDGKLKLIKEAIITNLHNYNISFNVINFKNYGNPSQRTRTLVIGTRKDLTHISPIEFMPNKDKVHTLREIIGNMRSLKRIGDIDDSDIYHSFRQYPAEMELWVKNIKEGESAFNNKKINNRPHTIKNGQIIINKNKNGDKYKRCYWDLPMPCIHTRNDIMASQMTLHPKDNRVFSIKELMMLMSIKNEFRWSSINFDKLNKMTQFEKKKFLKSEELNIRRCIGESVPPIIFDKIAKNILSALQTKNLNNSEISELIYNKKLYKISNLKKFIKTNIHNFSSDMLSRIVEAANSQKEKYAAYYTTKHICMTLINNLPDFDVDSTISILEPSVGSGVFIMPLIRKYQHCKKIRLDVIDIDKDMLEITKLLLSYENIPKNVQIRFLNADFLTFVSKNHYNIVVGNPPFGKITNNPKLLQAYKKGKHNQNTNNRFAFFIEKSIEISNFVSLIVPKSLLSTPEFNDTRKHMQQFKMHRLIDFGQKAFDIKIETIGFMLETAKTNKKFNMVIESFITNKIRTVRQSYVMSNIFPYWLLYRNKYFDTIATKMNFGVLSAFRDRRITKKITKKYGSIRVLKSRNIDNNEIKNILGYDSYINKTQLGDLTVAKFLNSKKSILIPNLTYNPRACFMPNDSICDGSVAIATPQNKEKINKTTLEYYSTDEFRKFYMLARNLSIRSLNIDSNSIFFFGKLIKQ